MKSETQPKTSGFRVLISSGFWLLVIKSVFVAMVLCFLALLLGGFAWNYASASLSRLDGFYSPMSLRIGDAFRISLELGFLFGGPFGVFRHFTDKQNR